MGLETWRSCGTDGVEKLALDLTSGFLILYGKNLVFIVLHMKFETGPLQYPLYFHASI